MKIYLHPQTEQEISQFLSDPRQSLLLAGPAYSGKKFLARHLANQLTRGQNPSNSISSYDGVKAGIDSVRTVISSLKLKPANKDDRRVVIITDIDRLGHEAQNALLKILEEPPQNTVFIVTSSDQSSILPTVLSRTNVLNVRPLSLELANKMFAAKHEAAEIRRAHALSGGAASLMINLLDRGDHELLDAVNWAKKILQMTAYERLLAVDDLTKNKGDKLASYIEGIEKVLRASLLHGKNLSHSEAKRRVSQLVSASVARRNLELNVSPKLVLTNLFLKL